MMGFSFSMLDCVDRRPSISMNKSKSVSLMVLILISALLCLICLANILYGPISVRAESAIRAAESCSDISNIFTPLKDSIVFSHDGEYTKLDADLIQRELSKLGDIDSLVGCKEARGYVRGVQVTFQALLKYFADNSVVANNRIDYDPNHWFEVNLANVMIFDNLDIPNEELFPGRLFSTRMPRKIDTDSIAKSDFSTEISDHKVATVVVLVETTELQKYGSSTLLDLYTSLGVEVLHRPIVDYSIPDSESFTELMRDVLYRLAQGNNVLVHCAGGTGRTGIALAGVAKSVGIRDPTAWIRRVKSTYVETLGQENFVALFPPVFDDRITAMKPIFAKGVVAEQLLQLYIRDKDLTIHANDMDVDSSNPFAMKPMLIQVFALVDTDKSNDVSVDELERLFDSVGANSVSSTIFDALTLPFVSDPMTQSQFVNLLSVSSMNTRH